ncbi:MAG: hypothetical protein AVO35_05365 [Candidatus Aegiribacteria sp. MLS_C]|nr:MAG: hypothetical protein AVO35_05365 [Candidatus Aegiribacteria sp. MLS_C]
MTDGRLRLLGYTAAAGVLAADQVAKRMALGWLDLHRPVEVIGNLLRLTLVWNSGAAFSLPWGGPVFLAVITGAAAVLVSILIWRLRDRSPGFVIGLGAILGGALGNLLDRFMYGRVVDFIDIGLGGSRWPTFNVADVAITMGGLVLVILYRRKGPGETGESEDEGRGSS